MSEADFVGRVELNDIAPGEAVQEFKQKLDESSLKVKEHQAGKFLDLYVGESCE